MEVSSEKKTSLSVESVEGIVPCSLRHKKKIAPLKVFNMCLVEILKNCQDGISYFSLHRAVDSAGRQFLSTLAPPSVSLPPGVKLAS